VIAEYFNKSPKICRESEYNFKNLEKMYKKKKLINIIELLKLKEETIKSY